MVGDLGGDHGGGDIPAGTQMVVYQATAPLGWVTVPDYPYDYYLVMGWKGAGHIAGVDSPMSCAAVPSHSHVLIPQEHRHDMRTYSRDWNDNPVWAIDPTPGEGYEIRSGYTSQVSLSIEGQTPAAKNIRLRCAGVLVVSYEGSYTLSDEAFMQVNEPDDYALTVGYLMDLPEPPAVVPPGTLMFFYNRVAPLGWTQHYIFQGFCALVTGDFPGQFIGDEDPTYIGAVPYHTHTITPNPHDHDMLLDYTAGDGGGGTECTDGAGPTDWVGETTLTIADYGPGIEPFISLKWAGVILCSKDYGWQDEWLDTLRAYEPDWAVPLYLLEYFLEDAMPSFPPGANAIFVNGVPSNGKWQDISSNVHGRVFCAHDDYGEQQGGLHDPWGIFVCPAHTHNVTPNPHKHTAYHDCGRSGRHGSDPYMIDSYQGEDWRAMLQPRRLDIEFNDGGRAIDFKRVACALGQRLNA